MITNYYQISIVKLSNESVNAVLYTPTHKGVDSLLEMLDLNEFDIDQEKKELTYDNGIVRAVIEFVPITFN